MILNKGKFVDACKLKFQSKYNVLIYPCNTSSSVCVPTNVTGNNGRLNSQHELVRGGNTHITEPQDGVLEAMESERKVLYKKHLSGKYRLIFCTEYFLKS